MHQAPYYWNELTPILKENKVIYFTHADSRLANNDLPDDIQKLRCRVNYGALKYAEPIRQLADTLINRMQEDSPYIALHLRCGDLYFGEVLELCCNSTRLLVWYFELCIDDLPFAACSELV